MDENEDERPEWCPEVEVGYGTRFIGSNEVGDIEDERDASANLADIVAECMMHRASGHPPLGGWDLFWLEVESAHAEYLRASNAAPKMVRPVVAV